MSDPKERSNAAKAATYGRARHRAKQHASAHEDEAHDPHAKHGVDHPLVCRKAGELITTPGQFAEFIEHLKAQKAFAYDTEFIGELTYHPRLCLIQAATTQRIGLIDPMAELDLTPFWLLLADASIVKIVHAGEQDIEPVFRLIGQRAQNIFDTQIAAGFVRLAYPVGLAKLVLEMLGAKLSKGLTFTHWDQRPLSNQQLRYAADDVRYLPALYEEISKRIAAAGHTAAAREEFDELCEPTRYQFDPANSFWRVRGSGGLMPANLAVLRALTVWRNEAAKQHDVPPRALMKDEILIDLSRHPIKDVEKLGKIKGLPRPIEQEHGAELVEVTAKALAEPPEKRPHSTPIEPSPSERFAAEAFYGAAMVICAGQGVDPALVASRQEVGDLFRRLTDKKPTADLHLMQGWRRTLCGQYLLDLYECKFDLRLSCENDSLQLKK